MLGLTQKEIDLLQVIFKQAGCVQKAVLFGSRAMGLHRHNSDVDIAIYGDGITLRDILRINAKIEETTMPYMFDFVLGDNANEALAEHIKTYGKIIYEIGKWQKMKLCEAICFNPTERLPKGTIAKKVAMDKLQPFVRDIPAYEIAPYNGGAKFRNDDTIMARITPCLENGKTAFVNFLDENEIGYGSTEFIVWRARDGATDSNYIYYLSQSPEIRDIAVKSMVGSSGRQRVQQSVLNNYEIDLPNLSTQRAIADTLSCLDDKIALNNRMNKTLEEMAQAIFKSWFVDFEPWGGVMPGDWEYYILNDLCMLISKGITPKYDDESNQVVINQKCIRNKTINLSLARTHLPKKINEKWLNYGDILINSTGEGTLGRAAQFLYECDNYTADSHVTIVRPAKKSYIYYLGQWCLLREKEFASMASGSTGQTDLPRERLKTMESLLPNIATLECFNDIINPMLEKQISVQQESARLAAIRDALLPKLMSGEIEIK